MLPDLVVTSGVSVTVALIGVGASVLAARHTAVSERSRQREERAYKAARVVARFSEPLGLAAFQLQSRLYNILCQTFLESYLIDGNRREQAYAIENTAYVIAQFFAWNELLRIRVQFLDMGKAETTRGLNALLDNLVSLWQTDDYDRCFRIWAGDQRAIGERMLRRGRCMGYADFLDVVHRSPARIPGIRRVMADVLTQAEEDRARRRLTAIQHRLVDLLAFLDPHGLRFPAPHRLKACARDDTA